MITEDRLTQLLEEAASHFEPPADGATRVLVAADAPVAHPSRRRVPPLALAAIAASVVLLAAIGLLVADRRGPTTKAASQSLESAPHTPPTAASAGDSANGPALAALAAAPAGQPATAAAPAAPLTKIIKSGSVDLEVARGRVGATIDRISATATGAGGFVADSKSAETDGHPTGAVTVRVPADHFESVTADLRKLGKVRSAATSGNDVTAEYTDNAARLHTLMTSRDSLREVLSKARAIGDILAVQDRLNDVQTQIEQLQGRQNVLDNQVALGTIAVTVHEPGQAAVTTTPHRSAWSRAAHGFASTWSSILAQAGTALALLLALAALAALVFAVARYARRAYVRLRA